MTLLEDTRAQIAAAELKAGRDAGSVRLIAVSKVQPIERVEAALAAGHRLYGENRVQEAAGKWPALRERFEGVELHLIGPLQTNKLRQALDLFDTIQSLDRLKLARKLAHEIQTRGACPLLFAQVNTGSEAQKSGVSPDEIDPFLSECRGPLGLPIAGLMAIPPANEDPAPHFALLAEMAKRNGLSQLSMGMSADFEAAIAHGATHIRVGSGVFGPRDYG